MQAENVKLDDSGAFVTILDQTKLPTLVETLDLRTEQDFYDAIYELKVRGAPAIGICAAYGIYVLSRDINAEDFSHFYQEFVRKKERLNASRPTAVNLSWALNRMEQALVTVKELPIPKILACLEKEAKAIQEEDIAMCHAISRHGLTLLKEGDGILTHCNAGPLATSCYGTALGPILLGKEKGMNFKVFADETRPLLQGARLTSYELFQAGVDITLICDNMASIVMKNGWVQVCFVGCDRIAKNGDTANKIGTSGVAILAKHYNIPFYVLGPTSTIDLTCETGEDIEIELRNPSEIRDKFYKQPMALAEVPCYNPAFDVTDHSLIAGIITEHGILRPPYTESLTAAKSTPSISVQKGSNNEYKIL